MKTLSLIALTFLLALAARADADPFEDDFIAAIQPCKQQRMTEAAREKEFADIKLNPHNSKIESEVEARKALQLLRNLPDFHIASQKAFELVAQGIPENASVRKLSEPIGDFFTCSGNGLAITKVKNALIGFSKKLTQKEQLELKSLIISQTKDRLSRRQPNLELLMVSMTADDAMDQALINTSSALRAEWTAERTASRELGKKVSAYLEPHDFESLSDKKTIPEAVFIKISKSIQTEFQGSEKIRLQMNATFEKIVAGQK